MVKGLESKECPKNKSSRIRLNNNIGKTYCINMELSPYSKWLIWMAKSTINVHKWDHNKKKVKIWDQSQLCIFFYCRNLLQQTCFLRLVPYLYLKWFSKKTLWTHETIMCPFVGNNGSTSSPANLEERWKPKSAFSCVMFGLKNSWGGQSWCEGQDETGGAKNETKPGTLRVRKTHKLWKKVKKWRLRNHPHRH